MGGGGLRIAIQTPDPARSFCAQFSQPLPGGTLEKGELVLVDLEPGQYTIVCLFPDSEGIPHLAQGMAATFTVK